MFLKLCVVLLVSLALAQAQLVNFIYNGFAHPTGLNLSLDGIAETTDKGLLTLTNDTKWKTGHAFYPNPVTFKNSSDGRAFSFSTSFVFAIRPRYPNLGGHGIAFVISPTRGLPGALSGQHLGLFNRSNKGNLTHHVFAVELDTSLSREFQDIDGNHVGIDIDGLHSLKSTTAGYYHRGLFKNLSLIGGQKIRVWMDYNGIQKYITVTLAPLGVSIKPQTPLLYLKYDLSPILNQKMFVGFSSSTGLLRSYHYVLGWSFRINGQAQCLIASELPLLPRIGSEKRSMLWTFGALLSVTLLVLVVSGVDYVIRRKGRFAEVLEEWELQYETQRFMYKDLYIATKGFKNLLGVGGFGKVYRGVLVSSKIEVAVKKISHESRQGMREFVAEIASIGRIQHQNLVHLLGYCRRNGELLLVYDYMANGSLDRYLYNQPAVTLNWTQRIKVIKGVASALSYLHDEWEQVVIHRDVKASNVLLDEDFNARLGDFGLARLYEHGADPPTTDVAGTFGYLAPEHARTGRATTSSDVYAFGILLLEVACGRRTIEAQGPEEDIVLADRVFSCWNRRHLLEARDPKLGTDFTIEEVELILKLGLLCSRSQPTARPTMRQIVQYLEGDMALPELSFLRLSSTGLEFANDESFDNVEMSDKSSYAPESSVVSGGR